MATLFCDVSHHDWDRRGGALDWGAIRAAGLGTVMCARASYGDPQVFNPPSPHFGDYMAGAKAAAFTVRGGYHNLIRGDAASIARQVDLLRSTMDKHGTEWAMADVEAYPELVTQGLVPRWEDVQRFHDRWYAVDGRVMAWYIAQWVWAGKLGAPNLSVLRGPLINANYKGGDGTAQQIYAAAGNAGWAEYVTVVGNVTRRSGRRPDIWQYTSTGNVPGASNNTDCNAYPGDMAALVAILTGRTVPSGGTEDMPLVFFRVNETAACGVSNGPTRWGFSTMEDLNEALAAQGKTLQTPGALRAISQARLGAYGVDVSSVDDPPFALTDEQLAQLDFGADDLAAVEAASTKGAMAAMPSIVDSIVAKLPAGAMTRSEVEAAVRDAFAGGLAPDTTP